MYGSPQLWVKDLEDLDRERDDRERQREGVGRDQTVRAHQHEGRKKMRSRIGCKGRVLHLGHRQGGTIAGTRGVALDLRELLADLFC